MLIKIILGILGLGVVVFIHELGHFTAAKIFKVKVLTFSIGWGPVLLRKKIGTTEYRLSAIPLGGYCGMEGETAYQRALEENLPEIPLEEGSLYSVNPLKRILIAVAGPLFNLLFAAFALIIYSSIPYTYYTTPARIILASEYDSKYENFPANTYGLETGDIIKKIDGKNVSNFDEITNLISINPGKELTLEIDRNGQIEDLTIVPKLNPETGTGEIGVYPYIQPLIREVAHDSKAMKAGLKAGDTVTALNGTPVQNTLQINKIIGDPEVDFLEIKYLTAENSEKITTINLDSSEDKKIGITWEYITVTEKSQGFFDSIFRGIKGTAQMTALTIKSLGLLFKGIDISKAVSGPLRITYMLGEVTSAGFSAGISQGILVLMNFLAIINISLFIMNLLPIPVLDGGLVLLSLIELISQKKIKPKFMYYFQTVGAIIILTLIIFAFWMDISFFVK